MRDGGGAAGFAFVIGVLAAGLTSFYSWRLIFMTFHGKPKWGPDAVPAVINEIMRQARRSRPTTSRWRTTTVTASMTVDPHEPSWSIRFPLIMLAIGAAGAGALFVEQFIGEDRAAFWRGAIFTGPANHVLEQIGSLPAWETWAPLAVTALASSSRFGCTSRTRDGRAPRRSPRAALPLHLQQVVLSTRIYDFVFVRGAKALGDLFWKAATRRSSMGWARTASPSSRRGSADGSASCRPAMSTTTPS